MKEQERKRAEASLERVLGISRELEDEERCTVSHPAAGGPCPETATISVYGLPFCTPHGEEARVGLFARLLHQWEEVPRQEDGLDSLITRAYVSEFASDFRSDFYEKEHPRLIELAHPIMPEEHVDEYTRQWRDEGPKKGQMHPVDGWFWTFMDITLTMLEVSQSSASWLVEELEPWREWAVAQHRYARALNRGEIVA